MGIMSYIKNAKYNAREKLKKREMFEAAELEEIRKERKALKTRADLRSEKKALRKDKFNDSFIGRTISGVKELKSQPKTRRSSKKKKVMVRGETMPQKGKGFGNHEINEAFSLKSGQGKKKRFFYE